MISISNGIFRVSAFINLILSFIIGITSISCTSKKHDSSFLFQRLKVSENKRFLQYENGDPFFWLGDTGWLLFQKLSREEAAKYLQDM